MRKAIFNLRIAIGDFLLTAGEAVMPDHRWHRENCDDGTIMLYRVPNDWHE